MIVFLRGADCVRYGNILEDLDNDYVKGVESYTNMVLGACILLTNYRNKNPYNHPG